MTSTPATPTELGDHVTETDWKRGTRLWCSIDARIGEGGRSDKGIMSGNPP